MAAGAMKPEVYVGVSGWTRVAAPVGVPDTYNNYCQLLPGAGPAADNSHVVEILTTLVDSTRIARFATGPVDPSMQA